MGDFFLSFSLRLLMGTEKQNEEGRRRKESFGRGKKRSLPKEGGRRGGRG